LSDAVESPATNGARATYDGTSGETFRRNGNGSPEVDNGDGRSSGNKGAISQFALVIVTPAMHGAIVGNHARERYTSSQSISPLPRTFFRAESRAGNSQSAKHQRNGY
jgi:hypothetical protein